LFRQLPIEERVDAVGEFHSLSGHIAQRCTGSNRTRWLLQQEITTECCQHNVGIIALNALKEIVLRSFSRRFVIMRKIHPTN
jgi:hypothetical protein